MDLYYDYRLFRGGSVIGAGIEPHGPAEPWYEKDITRRYGDPIYIAPDWEQIFWEWGP